ncbi:uncharacterized protein LOC110599267 [Ictidomys tridecemlineatus]
MAAAAPAAAPASGPAPLAPRAARSAPGLAAPSTQLPAPGARTQSPGAAGGGGGGGLARGARPHRRGLRPGAERRPLGGGGEPRPRRRRPERGQQSAPRWTRSREGGGPWPAGAPGSRAPAAAASLHLGFKWGRKEGEGEITAEGTRVKGKGRAAKGKEGKKEGLREFPVSLVRDPSVGSAGGRGLERGAGPRRAPGRPEGRLAAAGGFGLRGLRPAALYLRKRENALPTQLTFPGRALRPLPGLSLRRREPHLPELERALSFLGRPRAR